MRLTGRTRPEDDYEYLLDVVAVDMAAAVLPLTDKPLRKRSREKAVKAELDRMHRTWAKSLLTRPHLAADGIRDLRRPRDLDAATRFTLLVDAAFVDPYRDKPKLALSATERRAAMHDLAARLDLEPSDADATLREVASANRVIREDDGPSAARRAIDAVTGVGNTAAGYVVAVPKLFEGKPRGTAPAPSRLPDQADQLSELVMLCVHAVVVDLGLRQDDHAVSATVEVLAERRADAAREIDLLEGAGATKDELREFRAAAAAIERAIDWLIHAELAA